MGSLEQAPGALVVLGITCAAVGLILFLALMWAFMKRLADVPRVPRGAGSYFVMVVLCLACLGAGASALLVADALADWEPAQGRVAVGEVRCQKLGPTLARLTFVPLAADGTRAPEESQTLPPADCDVAVERLTFPPQLARLGLLDRQRVARVGAQRRPIITAPWHALPQPMGVPLASASELTLAVPPDADARPPYRVIADSRGLSLERSTATQAAGTVPAEPASGAGDTRLP